VVRLTVLGSTGSIGVSTLDVVRQNPDRFEIHNLVAGRNLDILCSQILEFKPKTVVVADSATVDALQKRLHELNLPARERPALAQGAKARVAAVVEPEVDFVMSAIVGVTGLEATYAAIQHKKRIGLANKEVLVASGQLVMKAVRDLGVELIPVDSEHNGAFCPAAGPGSCGGPSAIFDPRDGRV
jgi:1-deoxy-D-xylulose-5-phosphate reductoisomerase